MEKSEKEIASVILAAGKSSRMEGLEQNKTSLPGPDGKPLILTAVELFERETDPVVVVIGEDPQTYPDSVRNSLDTKPDVQFATVDTQGNGTRYSFAAGLKYIGQLPQQPDSVILGHGDNLMRLTGEVFNQFVDFYHADQPAIGMMTAIHPDPVNSSAGKIARDEQGNVAGIVEKKDATPEQREIEEINFGLYCMALNWALEHIDRIPKSPVTGEIYATELVRMAIEEGGTVKTFPIEYGLVGNDVNTPADYKALLQTGYSNSQTF